MAIQDCFDEIIYYIIHDVRNNCSDGATSEGSRRQSLIFRAFIFIFFLLFIESGIYLLLKSGFIDDPILPASINHPALTNSSLFVSSINGRLSPDDFFNSLCLYGVPEHKTDNRNQKREEYPVQEVRICWRVVRTHQDKTRDPRHWTNPPSLIRLF